MQSKPKPNHPNVDAELAGANDNPSICKCGSGKKRTRTGRCRSCASRLAAQTKKANLENPPPSYGTWVDDGDLVGPWDCGVCSHDGKALQHGGDVLVCNAPSTPIHRPLVCGKHPGRRAYSTGRCVSCAHALAYANRNNDCDEEPDLFGGATSNDSSSANDTTDNDCDEFDTDLVASVIRANCRTRGLSIAFQLAQLSSRQNNFGTRGWSEKDDELLKEAQFVLLSWPIDAEMAHNLNRLELRLAAAQGALEESRREVERQRALAEQVEIRTQALMDLATDVLVSLEPPPDIDDPKVARQAVADLRRLAELVVDGFIAAPMEATEVKLTHKPSPTNQPGPRVHRCRQCGALWRDFGATWSLVPGSTAKRCCDNVDVDIADLELLWVCRNVAGCSNPTACTEKCTFEAMADNVRELPPIRLVGRSTPSDADFEHDLRQALREENDRLRDELRDSEPDADLVAQFVEDLADVVSSDIGRAALERYLGGS